MSDYIPMALASNVVNWVIDARELVKWRRVSKELRALIDSRDFVQSQLQRSEATGSNLRLFLETSHNIYYLPETILDAPPPDFRLQPTLYYQSLAGSKLLGTCHGLVCFWIDLASKLQILNPSTGERCYLPISRSPFDFFGGPFWHGFGYDQLSDDYKVVRILYLPNLCLASCAEIYCIRARSSRTLRLPFRPHGPQKNGVFACGALHWVARTGIHRCSLFALDLGSETVRKVRLPVLKAKLPPISVGVMNSCLCISALRKDLQRVDFWVMAEYGCKDTWCRIYRIHLGFLERNILSVTFVGCSRSNGGRVLFLLNHSELFWYDPVSYEVQAVEINGICGRDDAKLNAYYCMESLVKILP